MKQSDAYTLLCKEYLSKCNACDECIAECYCIKNFLRSARVPQKDCPEKIKAYLSEKIAEDYSTITN